MNPKVALLEVASVLAIIGSVAAIAVPKAGEIQSGRTATVVAADVETVRAAVLAFHSDSAYFPAEAPLGDIPASLEPYLPPRFSFRRPYGLLEYHNWQTPRAVAVLPTVRADSSVADSAVANGGRDTSASLDSALAGIPVDTGLAALSPRIAARGARVPPEILARPAAADRLAAADSVLPGRIIGVSVTTRDPRVGLIAFQRARRMARFVVGDKVTFVIFGA